MKKTFPISTAVLFLACVSICRGQSVRFNINPPYTGIGSYSAVQKDPFSFAGNQAALADLKSAGAGIYSERRFMLAETTVTNLAACIPTGAGNVGLQVGYAGFGNFNESRLAFAHARKLGDDLNIGAQLNYYRYDISQYGSASTLNFEIGAIIRFTPRLRGGIHIYNPLRSIIVNSGERMPAIYKAGFGYDSTDDFFITTEIIKEEGKPVNVTGGVQYRFADRFFARAGFMAATGSAFAGAGMKWKKIRIDLSSVYHIELGFSPGILLIVDIEKEKKQ